MTLFFPFVSSFKDLEQKLEYYVGLDQLVNYEDLTKGFPNTVMLLEPSQSPTGGKPPSVFADGVSLLYLGIAYSYRVDGFCRSPSRSQHW